MRVRALKLGYYDLKRWRPGMEFDMADQFYAPKDAKGSPLVSREGRPIICSWVEVVDATQAPSGKKYKRSHQDTVISASSEVI